MAYPQIVGTPATTATTTGTAMNLPASITSGNLLVLAIAHRHTTDGSVTSVAGFTEQADDGTTSHLAIYTRTADGTEGSTVTATFGGTGHTAATCWEISGWDGFVASVANVSGSPTTHDPASISTGVGSRECLMLALDASQSQTVTVSSYPSGYSNGTSLRSAASGSALRLNSATLEVTASSEDPGAFTLSGGTTGAVGGILIYAAGGGGGIVIPVFHHNYIQMRG